MIFCNECFKDVQIRSIIEGVDKKKLSKKGICPTCKKKNVFLYDTDVDNSLIDFFNELILIYTPREQLNSDYPASEIHMLSDELKNQWNIFSDSIGSNAIYEIIKSLSPDLYADSSNLFDLPIGVPEKYDNSYLEEYSILRGNSWDDFVECIKHQNRFHTKMINTDKLKTYLSYLRKDYNKGTNLYRGRLCYEDIEYKAKEMGAPPCNCAKEGRANSNGISRLYLADSAETCIHEIRAGAFDVISIGKFKLQEDISVIDFKQINNFSPFNDEFNFLEYLLNKPILQKIDDEMGRAVRSSDNHLDYISTQYLCDFIKSLDCEYGKKYSGVEYTSTLNNSGYNLAIFYPELFKCISVSTYKINALKYNYDIT